MPKPRGGVFRAAKRDTRYQAFIQACMPPRYDWNHQHVSPPVPDAEQALDVQRGVYRSARHLGITAHDVQMTEQPNGTWVVRFQLVSKAAGKKAIVAKVQAGEALAYNLRRNQ